MRVIEGGLGWLNVQVTTTDFHPNVYIIAPVRAVVDGGRLSQFTSSDVEVQFLANNNVSTAYSPLLQPGSDGYNSGNDLIGLDGLEVVDLISLTSQRMCSCDGRADWSDAAVDQAV